MGAVEAGAEAEGAVEGAVGAVEGAGALEDDFAEMKLLSMSLT